MKRTNQGRKGRWLNVWRDTCLTACVRLIRKRQFSRGMSSAAFEGQTAGPTGRTWARRNFSHAWGQVMAGMAQGAAGQLFHEGFSKEKVREQLGENHRQRRDLRRTGIVRLAEAGARRPRSLRSVATGSIIPNGSSTHTCRVALRSRLRACSCGNSNRSGRPARWPPSPLHRAIWDKAEP